MIERLDEELRELNVRIAMLIGVMKGDVERIGRVPCVGCVAAQSILAEICYVRRFKSGKQIAS